MKETIVNCVAIIAVLIGGCFAITKCSSCADKDRVALLECAKIGKSIPECKDMLVR